MMDVEKASQGKVTGVIIPPPEIRAVVDRTAQFVGKNGKSFEQRILNSAEGKTAKFNFMKQFDPYHAYYEMKISETEAAIARGETIEKPKPAAVVEAVKEAPKTAVAASVSTSTKATLMNPIAKILQRKSTDVPAPFEFIIPTPVGLTPEDVDIIKLTAQYTAANGRDFLAGVAMREQRNPQFDFLKPTHMLFSYFTSLVDSYMKVINPSAELLAKIERMTVFDNVLESAVHRWDYTKREEIRKRTESAQNDEERLAFQQIDWFDFTVVETIEFPEDELLEIPGMEGLGMSDSAPPANGTGHAAVPPPPAAPAAPTAPKFSVAPPPPPPIAPVVPTAPVAPVYHTAAAEEDDSELKIVSNYVPRIAGSGTGKVTNTMTMMDPISGKMIPVDQMEEHMRVQLLDPKWREEQKRFIEKQKETGYAEGGSIADSLKNFAKKRGDIFGQAALGTGETSAAAIAEEEKMEQARYEDSVQWDGHYGSISTVQNQKVNQEASFAARGLLPQPPTNLPPAIGPSLTAPAPPAPVPAVPFAVPPPAPVPAAPQQPSAMDAYAMQQQYMAQFQAQSAPVVAASLPMAPPLPFPGFGFPPTVVAPAAPVPPPMMMMAPPLPVGAYDVSNGEPSAKKAKTEAAMLVPAEEFAAQNPHPISLSITLPVDTTPQGITWNLNGSTLSLSNVNIGATVKDVKDLLATQFLNNMPASKQQLKSATLGFLKDMTTLAAYNLTDGTSLELTVKSRGGKK